MGSAIAGRPLDGPDALGAAIDEFLATWAQPPTLLAIGEPTHGIAAFPLLRNEILRHLVGRGYQSIALETDIFAATTVDDFVAGAPGEVGSVLGAGFSHGFGNVPGNRELVEWLRTHNSGRSPADRVRFHGFDAPLETSAAPSPRGSLTAVRDFLPAALRPASADDLDVLSGDDAEWSNPAAMFDPAVSIGDSDRARALRVVADDLFSALRRAAPGLSPADPAGFDAAVAHARTALGLLRYHAAMARPAPDRIGVLLSVRAEMMADNLHAILAQERDRGPCLVFAHNVHLLRAPSEMSFGADPTTWWSAGALLGRTLGERYVVIATDANPDSDPTTLQGVLAAATDHRTLFRSDELRAALPPSIGPGEPIVPGHIPLRPSDLAGTDAVVFIADTDGRRHQYW